MLEQGKYSNFGEEAIIKKYMDQFGVKRGYAVDIGASNGRCSSNTLALYEGGWSGLCIECDPLKFTTLSSNYQELPNVTLLRQRIAPDNVRGLLLAFCPEINDGISIDFLDIDIDGYDYYVLDSILSLFRPKLICAEINQSIPPPVRFTVDYSPGYKWAFDGFFGMSLSQADALCRAHDYQIVAVEYNNVFMILAELSNEPPKTINDLYHEGFLDRSDSREKLVSDWGMIRALTTLPDDEKITYINSVFGKYKGRFTCQI